MNNRSLSKRSKLIYLLVAFALVFSTVGYSGIMALREVMSGSDEPDYMALPTRAEVEEAVNAQFDWRKVTSKADVPEAVMEAIGQLELDRGSAGFTRMDFGGESTWMLLCGGEDFTDGYDAEINLIRYGIVGWLSESGERNGTPTADTDRVYAGVFLPYIRETAIATVYDYAEDAEYPFVLFEITSTVLEYDYLNGQVIVASDNRDDDLQSLQYGE